MRLHHLHLLDLGPERTLYVLGTGPSVRLFPIELLHNKPVLCLNQAWRYLRGRTGQYGLTVHPELVQEYEAEGGTGVSWVVKRKGPFKNLALDDERYYLFDTAEDWDLFRHPRKDTLFIGRGIQQTALDLARRMGAQTIILIGVDMVALGGDHHGHAQHVQFHGLAPAAVYQEYRNWTAKARQLLWKHARVPVLQLTPLLGAGPGEEDYRRLCHERQLAKLPAPPDVSTYQRRHTDDP